MEYVTPKIDEVYDQLTNDVTLKMYTERPMCNSCEGVLRQFHQRFPKIKLKVVSGFSIGYDDEDKVFRLDDVKRAAAERYLKDPNSCKPGKEFLHMLNAS